MEDAHAKRADEVLRFFGTGPDGLTSEQVDRLREEHGYNGAYAYAIPISRTRVD